MDNYCVVSDGIVMARLNEHQEYFEEIAFCCSNVIYANPMNVEMELIENLERHRTGEKKFSVPPPPKITAQKIDF